MPFDYAEFHLVVDNSKLPSKQVMYIFLSPLPLVHY